MIDLHTHSLLSDGELMPAELTRRFEAAGYQTIAITDHGDPSNVSDVIPKLVAFCDEINRQGALLVIPGIELTHVPPALIATLISRCRYLGAKLVVVHGESVVEPVAKGTNRMAIEASVDILAHPGLITEEEVILAKKNAVYLELTSRKGHSLTNGHVARLAQMMEVPLVVNSDTHATSDIWPAGRIQDIVLGAGLTIKDFHRVIKNAEQIAERCLRSERS